MKTFNYFYFASNYKIIKKTKEAKRGLIYIKNSILKMIIKIDFDVFVSCPQCFF